MTHSELQKVIATLLDDFERSTGHKVKDITIDNIDTTQVHDETREALRIVRVNLEWKYRWAK